MRRLNTFVHINVDGETRSYGPDDDVPADVAKRITNTDAWEDAAAAATDEGGSEEPPRSGAGSGKDAWKAYADNLGVDYDDDATRDDIIAAVDAANS